MHFLTIALGACLSVNANALETSDVPVVVAVQPAIAERTSYETVGGQREAAKPQPKAAVQIVGAPRTPVIPKMSVPTQIASGVGLAGLATGMVSLSTMDGTQPELAAIGGIGAGIGAVGFITAALVFGFDNVDSSTPQVGVMPASLTVKSAF